MAEIQYKPDIDNYLDRINEIEQLIITDSAVVKNPVNVPMHYPYWLHIAGGGAPQKASSNQWLETYSIRILLVRSPAGAMGDYEVETQILKDIANVAWYFMTVDDYRNLRTPTYTAIQQGFDPDSVTITNQIRFAGAVITGEVMGSLHTITFRHRNDKQTIGTNYRSNIMALVAATGMVAGAFYVQVAMRDSNGYAKGTLTDPETVAADTTTSALLNWKSNVVHRATTHI